MNPYIRAILPTMMKTLSALILGAMVAFGVPLLTIISSVGEIASGEIPLSQLGNTMAVAIPIFVFTASIIYAIWSLAQLFWAFVKRNDTKVEPERIPEGRIEEKIDEIKQALPDEQLKEPVPQENVDKYFKKYVKEEDLKHEEEEDGK